MTELGRRFLEQYVPTHCKPGTQGEYRRSVTLFIDPAIGEVWIAEVERKDIAKLHFDLRDKPYQANRTLGVISKMFSLAEIWGLRPDGSNPLPSRQAQQGEQARTVPVAGRDRAAARGPPRGR